jgi:MFS family permease
MGSGLFNTFVPLRLEMEEYDPEVIGAVVSAMYVGLLIGSLKIDRFITKVGHAKSFIAFTSLSGVLVLLQALWINPWYWASLRFVGGICMAGIFIVIESWILLRGTSSTRGVMLSLYLGALYGALTLGQFLINLSDPAGVGPFIITAFFCFLSILPMMRQQTEAPKIQPSEPLSLTKLFYLSPLGFLGGIISGMILAAVYGLIPVYAKEIGLSVAQIGNLMAMVIFGGLSLQWPIGRWADKGKRRHMIQLASFLSAFFAIGIAWIPPESTTLLLFFAWIFGGFSFTVYPLSMAYTCEKVKDHQIVEATGGFVLSYGIGAIAGPLLAPLAMDYFGAHGLFYFLAGISFFLGVMSLKRPAPETSPE